MLVGDMMLCGGHRESRAAAASDAVVVRNGNHGHTRIRGGLGVPRGEGALLVRGGRGQRDDDGRRPLQGPLKTAAALEGAARRRVPGGWWTSGSNGSGTNDTADGEGGGAGPG